MSFGQLHKKQLQTQVRWMIRRDMSDVLDIERQSFEFPWSEDDFLTCLRQRNCIGMVAESDDQIVGYMIYELLKSHLHVLNFAVRTDQRRQHVGCQMIDKLIGKLSQQRRRQITLEVRETNLDAQVFFRSCGFKAVEVLRGYYPDSEEDAYLMSFHLFGEATPEEEFRPHNRISEYEDV